MENKNIGTGGYERENTECPWCHEKFKARFSTHIKKVHNKSMKEYLMIRNDLSEWPKCKFCGDDVGYAGFNLYKTCGAKCKNKMSGENAVKSGKCAILAKTPEEKLIQSQRAKDIMTKRLEKHGTAFLNITKESYEKRSEYIRSNNILGARDDIYSYIYVGKFEKENLLKIGRTRNPDQRMGDYISAGIEFTELKFYKFIDRIARDNERTLKYTFRKSKILLPESYVPTNEFRRLGKTEFFNIEIYDKVVKMIETILDPIN